MVLSPSASSPSSFPATSYSNSQRSRKSSLSTAHPITHPHHSHTSSFSSLPQPFSKDPLLVSSSPPSSPTISRMVPSIFKGKWGKVARWLVWGYVAFAVFSTSCRVLSGAWSQGSRGISRRVVPSTIAAAAEKNTTAPGGWTWLSAQLSKASSLQTSSTNALNQVAPGYIPPSPSSSIDASLDSHLPWSPSFPISEALLTLPHHHSSLPSSAASSLFSSSRQTPAHHLVTSDLLSNMFSRALQPLDVIPYYYRASGPDGKGFEEDDITISTMITEDRFEALTTLVEKYRGPMSVVLYLPTPPPSSDPSTESAATNASHAAATNILTDLHTLYTTHPLFSLYVDVHLILSPHPRQFNLQRNVARFFARTEYVMMLDVDFVPCTDFRRRIRESKEVRELLDGGRAALVVPAFEFVEQEDGLDVSTFPTDKEDLLRLVEEGRIDMFHRNWQPGHSSTNYTAFYASPQTHLYRVTTYQHSYEPYVIFPRLGPPPCDERFVGYGGNKAACLYEIHLSGVEFYILGGDFVVHKSHEYAEKTRAHERKHNRLLYVHFRSELCTRYLLQHLQSDEGINHPRAKPMLRQCRKIAGFVESAQEFIKHHRSEIPFELASHPKFSPSALTTTTSSLSPPPPTSPNDPLAQPLLSPLDPNAPLIVAAREDAGGGEGRP